MRRIFAYLAALTLAFPAFSQTNCGSHEGITNHFKEKFDAALLMSGRSAKGYTLEIWMSQISDEWAALIVPGNGSACVVDGGTGAMVGQESIEPAGVRL